MKFREYIENYSSNLAMLRDYLRNPSLNVSEYIHEFLQWDGSTAILKRLRLSRKRLETAAQNAEFEGYLETACQRIDKSMSREERDEFVSYMVRLNPAAAPTWSIVDYRGLTKRTEWLVHFTDDPWGIKAHGFTHGMYDVRRLALTTHFTDVAKEIGGYNFAFAANSKYAKAAEREGKYGKHAVMLQSAGVRSHHSGDEEDQVIFFGPHVDPAGIVVLAHNDDWCVERSDGNCVFRGDFDKVVNWVMSNYQQYRRVL
jgi:hypothetical protein